METVVKLVPGETDPMQVELKCGAYYLDRQSRLWLCINGPTFGFLMINVETGDRRNPDGLVFIRQVHSVKISYR